MKSLKSELHSRNRHKGQYDFPKLMQASPALAPYVIKNDFGNDSINFANPKAVKALNQALLKYFYGLVWDIPDNNLCPPIPSRADYIHYLADLIGKKGSDVKILDIGVGANCIYPLIGYKEYGWHFVGSDIDKKSVDLASQLVTQNNLSPFITIKHQMSSHKIFEGIVGEDVFDACICNPPFHTSAQEARAGTERKWKNLKVKTKALNFGGQSNELWCPGGEVGFITRMIEESPHVNCQWFTTLVSKSESLPSLEKALAKVKPKQVKIIPMGQGQKISRILGWIF